MQHPLPHDNSKDLSSGRRPLSKSVEFLKSISVYRGGPKGFHSLLGNDLVRRKLLPQLCVPPAVECWCLRIDRRRFWSKRITWWFVACNGRPRVQVKRTQV